MSGLNLKEDSVTELFASLAAGGNARAFAASLVEAVTAAAGGGVRACVYEDREANAGDLFGTHVIIGGQKLGKEETPQQSFRFAVCGSTEEGRVSTFDLRLIVAGQLPDEAREGVESLGRTFAAEYESRLGARPTSASSRLRLLPGEDRPVVRHGIVAASAGSRQVLETVELFAPAANPVMITGETGTGKEMVAKALHVESGRKGRFVAINCGSICPELLAAELFGYEKGAFTGATAAKKGLVEEADGGTLFLDEIGEMPLKDQTALLRVLQEGKIRPVGSTREREVNVRVVTATHRNLKEMIEAGGFRQDLYYRLKGLTIDLPALRERRDEIPVLVDYFMHNLGAKAGREIEVTDEAVARLTAHRWEGNIRELVNVCEAAFVYARGGVVDRAAVDRALGHEPQPEIRRVVSAAPGALRPGAVGAHRPFAGSYRDQMDEFERGLLAGALARTDNNLTRAAHSLGMKPTTFRRRVSELGLRRESAQSPAARGAVVTHKKFGRGAAAA